LAAARLDDGEYPAARNGSYQDEFTKQGFSQTRYQPKADAILGWCCDFSSDRKSVAADYILVKKPICPNCKLIAGPGALILGQPFQRRFT
jgi:hypothetical protein